MKTYTASEIANASDLNPTTLRKWQNDAVSPLITDAAEADEGGWRRYTEADAVRIALLAKLVNEFGIAPSVAIPAINLMRPSINAFVAEILEVVREQKTWAAAQARPAWLQFDDLRSTQLRHRTKWLTSHGALIDALVHGASIVIEMTTLIQRATHSADLAALKPNG